MIAHTDLGDRTNPGAVYMVYQWWVGTCNELIQDNLNPISRIPEIRYRAVKVEVTAGQQ